MIGTDQKKCTKCGSVKDRSEFYKRTKAADGLNPWCKPCQIASVMKYYRENPEPAKRRAKEHGKANADRYAEMKKAKYQADPEKVKARASEWAKKNPGRRKEIAAASAEKNRKKKNAKAMERHRNLMASDPERVREENRMRASIRRSRVQDNGINISRSEWSAIIDVFGITCVYCGENGRKLTMDHFLPVKLGGKTEPGNLIPCCKPCNSSKGSMHPDLWLEKIGQASDVRSEGNLTIRQFLEVSRAAFQQECGEQA